jgi:hypothetical protein
MIYKIPFRKEYVLTLRAWIRQCMFYLTRKLKLHNRPF